MRRTATAFVRHGVSSLGWRLALGVLAAAACGGGAERASGPVAPSPRVPVASVSVSLGASRVEVGGVVQASAEPRDAAGGVLTGRAVSWTSAAPAVATVDDNGVVRGVTPGTAVITATSEGRSGSATLTVSPVPVATVQVSLTESSVLERRTTLATAQVRDAAGALLNGRSTVWASSATAIATVDGAGLVRALAPGTATITATSEGRSGSATLTVTALPVGTVSVVLESEYVIEGADTETARVVVLSATGDTLTGRSVQWTSSNPDVASIDPSGRIGAIRPGTTDLGALVEGRSTRARLIVEPRSKYQPPGWLFDYVDGSEPGMPRRDPSGAKAFAPQPGDPRPQIVIDESFSVPAGREVVWENRIVWVRPKQRRDINVYGRLVIRNSLLLWDQTEHQQSRLVVRRGGTLMASKSYAMPANTYWVNWNYEDGSTIRFDRFQGHVWTWHMGGTIDYRAVNASTVWLTVNGDTRASVIDVADAHHFWLEMYLPPGTHTLTLPEKERWASWTVRDLWPDTDVRVRNSFIYERDVGIGNGVHATILNTPSGFGLAWGIGGPSSATIRCVLTGLGNPDDDRGTLYADATWDLPCNNSSLRLRNTRLQRAWPTIWGNVHLTVRTSSLVDPGVSGPAIMEVYGASIDHLRVLDGGRVYLENSRIREDIQVNGTGSEVYAYRVTPRGMTPFRVLEEQGGRFVTLMTPGPPWPRPAIPVLPGPTLQSARMFEAATTTGSPPWPPL